MRLTWLLRLTAWPALALAGCGLVSPPPPTPESFTALYLVTAGPFPLYAEYGDWVADRVSGLPLADADAQTMSTRRVELARDPSTVPDGPWLHSNCIFDVQHTTPDEQETSYLWAYGRVVRCDELIETGLPEPQMGMRPRELLIWDGWVGYFPMSLLEKFTGAPPPPRR